MENQFSKIKNNLRLQTAIIMFFIISGCNSTIERSGYVVNKLTRKPLEGVSVEIYMKTQLKDSLKEKNFTDKTGYFQIKEKRNPETVFDIYKAGYIGQTSSLTEVNDTIFLEQIPN